MHLGIDIREACSNRPTGKGKWTQGFVRELLTRGLRLSLFTDADIPAEWKDLVQRSGASVVKLPQRGISWHRTVAKMLKPSGIQLYVSPTSYIVPALVGSSVRCVPVVHDLIAFRPERHDRRARFIERLTLRRAVKHAYRVCVTSQSTKADLLARYPSLSDGQVVPVFAGGGESHAPAAQSDGMTIVCIGTLAPRKNQARLICAFASLPSPPREKARLVLVGGRGWDDDEIVRLAQTTPGVEWHGYLADDAMDDLVRSAAVYAFPSLYEGFGLPLLDAFRRGIPLLTADRGSLREVAGEAALYCNPEDEADISKGLERLLTDESLRARLIAAGYARKDQFTWKRTVDLFLENVVS
jgi:glycosyltransferase involved in cell wall biosynthesis